MRIIKLSVFLKITQSLDPKKKKKKGKGKLLCCPKVEFLKIWVGWLEDYQKNKTKQNKTKQKKTKTKTKGKEGGTYNIWSIFHLFFLKNTQSDKKWVLSQLLSFLFYFWDGSVTEGNIIFFLVLWRVGCGWHMFKSVTMSEPICHFYVLEFLVASLWTLGSTCWT